MAHARIGIGQRWREIVSSGVKGFCLSARFWKLLEGAGARAWRDGTAGVASLLGNATAGETIASAKRVKTCTIVDGRMTITG